MDGNSKHCQDTAGGWKVRRVSQSESLSQSVSNRFIYKEFLTGIVINAVTNPKLAELYASIFELFTVDDDVVRCMTGRANKIFILLKHIISCSEHILSCFEHIVSCSEHILSCSEHIISCSKHMF